MIPDDPTGAGFRPSAGEAILPASVRGYYVRA